MAGKGVYFVPVTNVNAADYISTGTKSYHEHYTYLWKNGDTTPYIDKNFSPGAVSAELADPNNALYIIYSGPYEAGTLKLAKTSLLSGHPPKTAMLLNKIYLLKDFVGKGIGGHALIYVEIPGRFLGKSVLWLCSMQQGPHYPFTSNTDLPLLKKKGWIIRRFVTNAG